MALPELDPASLRAYVRRDWGATARLDLAHHLAVCAILRRASGVGAR